MDSQVWVEVDLKAIAHNVGELRRIAAPKARLMTVVKADGYGHGAVAVAGTALRNGAEVLGVARIGEAVRLRKAGIEAPILVFGFADPERTRDLAAFDLTQTVYSYRSAKALSDMATSLRRRIGIHVKVDTGMGRVGLVPFPSSGSASASFRLEEVVREIKAIDDLPGLRLEGVFTHFATADHADKSYADLQLKRFGILLDRLRQAGVRSAAAHAANSAATIDLPESHLDMVRTGISTYGLYPSDGVNKQNVALKPALQWKARIVQVKEVPPNFAVSYGCTFKTATATSIATVPVGYADGLDRRLSSLGRMLVGGRSAPIVGRVCMDLTMLDVGHIPGVKVGDEVVIVGTQGGRTITADEIASRLDTINYEIVSTITERVPRFYLP